MREINFLAWRRAERARVQQAMFIWMILGIFLGILCAITLYLYLEFYLHDATKASNMLQYEIAQSTKLYKHLDSLKKEKNNMLQRMKMINVYQSSRLATVQFLLELEKVLPVGIYLNSLQVKGNIVSVHGFAESNTDVSALMRHIETNSMMHAPKLTQIKQDIKAKHKLKDSTLIIIPKKDDVHILPNEFQLTFNIDGTMPDFKKL